MLTNWHSAFSDGLIVITCIRINLLKHFSICTEQNSNTNRLTFDKNFFFKSGHKYCTILPIVTDVILMRKD